MSDISTTQPNKFTYTGTIETITVATSGYYLIEAEGAQGGAGYEGTGGAGAIASGEVYLQAGAKLEVVVGGKGHDHSASDGGGGGGGGSFVIETNNGSAAVDVNEVIAGGGGGGGFQVTGQGGRAQPTGGTGGGISGAGHGGSGGHGDAPGQGASTVGGGGGGGFTGGAGGRTANGGGTGGRGGQAGSMNGTTFAGGASFGGGGGAGGFGGGGGDGNGGAGGGGGYGGGGGAFGAGGNYGTHDSGGGGGSFVNAGATRVSETAAANTANGLVSIDYMPQFTLPNNASTTFNYNGLIEIVTIANTGYYDITADGAQGGSGRGGASAGLGAMASGEVYLQAGAVLEVVVGGAGQSSSNNAGGGGGGSFVIEINDGSGAVDINEIIAGGGGGAGGSRGYGGARTTGTGGSGSYVGGGNGPGGSGGADGAAGAGGGGGSALGGGGGGFTGGNAGYAHDGAQDTEATSGSTTGATFAGGRSLSSFQGSATGGSGGFGGGGGATSHGGGGGGGYGGGGGGGYYGVGGGGGSLVNASALDVSKSGGTHSGNGIITIAPINYASLTDSSGITTYYSSLSAAIDAANADLQSSSDTITLLRDDIETANSTAINISPGLSLVIDGAGFSLNGNNTYRGLYVLSGNITVENLIIENAVAAGGAGANGGGGGAGLGGGLYVGNDANDGFAPANVTLSDVTFINDSAKGGAGGVGAAYSAGRGGFVYGGGGGGQGGNGSSDSSGGAGGAGVNGEGGGAPGSPGGFGGGGGSGANVGGAGGFGGGGGSGQSSGGGGGFGGGGGGAFNFNGTSAVGGAGGFGGGNGGASANGVYSGGGGGGGLGAGGDIFIQGGATLTIGGDASGGSKLNAGSATGGTAKSGGAGGAGFGGGLFIHGGTAAVPTTVILGAGQTATQTTTISGVIADVAGSGGTSGTGGSGGFGGTGALVIEGAGTVDLAVANSFFGGVTIQSGTLELGNPGGAGSGPITFDSGAKLAIDGSIMPTNTLDGFTSGDVIDLKSIANVAGSHADMNYATHVLTVSEGTSTYQFAFDPGESFAGDFFHLAAEKNGAGPGTLVTENNIACYTRGTLIATERGEREVETLEIGDQLQTASGRLRSIKWIGRRSYGGRFILGRKDILPICFKTGSLDDNVPRRDLWISPHHAMYLDGVLIEAKDLVNGVSILQAEQVANVEYFHIELETHDVILAEGALSESFVDDDSRGMFHNSHEYAALYPENAAEPARYCAPRLEIGYEVEAIRRKLAARAGLAAVEQQAGALRGCIDVVRERLIEGWAQNLDHPEAPVCLDIYAGGQMIGQTLANRYREDLEAAGLGSGRHAFRFSVPDGLSPVLGAVEVRRSLDATTLVHSLGKPSTGKDYRYRCRAG